MGIKKRSSRVRVRDITVVAGAWLFISLFMTIVVIEVTHVIAAALDQAPTRQNLPACLDWTSEEEPCQPV